VDTDSGKGENPGTKSHIKYPKVSRFTATVTEIRVLVFNQVSIHIILRVKPPKNRIQDVRYCHLQPASLTYSSQAKVQTRCHASVAFSNSLRKSFAQMQSREKFKKQKQRGMIICSHFSHPNKPHSRARLFLLTSFTALESQTAYSMAMAAIPAKAAATSAPMWRLAAAPVATGPGGLLV